jgi:hypothetical protein
MAFFIPLRPSHTFRTASAASVYSWDILLSIHALGWGARVGFEGDVVGSVVLAAGGETNKKAAKKSEKSRRRS